MASGHTYLDFFKKEKKAAVANTGPAEVSKSGGRGAHNNTRLSDKTSFTINFIKNMRGT